MKNGLEIILIPLLFLIVFSISIWWSIYKYNDCRAVGHTKTYCLLDIGN